MITFEKDMQLFFATNTEAEEDELIELSASPHEEVRMTVLEHKKVINATEETLIQLAASPFWEIRKAVLNHEKITTSVIIKLMRDKDESIKLAACAAMKQREGGAA